MCATAERPALRRVRRLGALCLVLALCGLAGLMPSPVPDGRLDPDAAFPDAGRNGSPEEQTETLDHADDSEMPVVGSLPRPRLALHSFIPAAVAHLTGPARPLIRPPSR